MKTHLLLLSIFLMSFNTFANHSKKLMKYMQPNFEITNIKPICPPALPGEVTCMAIGSIITVKTIIGCVDKIEMFKTQYRKEENNTVNIYIHAVATNDPRNEVIRCLKPNTIIKKISVPFFVNNHYELVNMKID